MMLLLCVFIHLQPYIFEYFSSIAKPKCKANTLVSTPLLNADLNAYFITSRLTARILFSCKILTPQFPVLCNKITNNKA